MRSSLLLSSALDFRLLLLVAVVIIKAVVEDVLLVDEETHDDACVLIESRFAAVTELQQSLMDMRTP